MNREMFFDVEEEFAVRYLFDGVTVFFQCQVFLRFMEE